MGLQDRMEKNIPTCYTAIYAYTKNLHMPDVLIGYLALDWCHIYRARFLCN